MLVVIKDCAFVARVQIGRATLKKFLGTTGQAYSDQLHTLSKRYQAVVCEKNKIRIRSIPGGGWYEITGYRQDGSDLRRALGVLQAADTAVHHEASRIAREAISRAQTCVTA